ncbi:MAG: type II secretion system GspH family protein [Rhodoferax sp.]|nr:type II secretion system GspH family protein [Rhodoferax sp.]MCF8211518.1 type II secretion system GspH family protein [Rhodoferax sp.]
MAKPSRQSHHGFTLVEIAIVMVIIGLLLAGILNAQSILRNARTQDTIKAVNDLANAAQQFRDRYGNWPGVLQNAAASIPGLTATSCPGNTAGVITSTAESACASEELIRSGMLRGDAATPIRVGATVTLSITGNTAALVGFAGLPANWRNVLRIESIDCDIAIQLDRATDDGNTATGNFRTDTACAGQDQNVLVANAALRLN